MWKFLDLIFYASFERIKTASEAAAAQIRSKTEAFSRFYLRARTTYTTRMTSRKSNWQIYNSFAGHRGYTCTYTTIRLLQVHLNCISYDLYRY